jgi:hypothetical protein
MSEKWMTVEAGCEVIQEWKLCKAKLGNRDELSV